MSGVVTLVIVLAILAVIGGGIWYFMSSNMSNPFGSQEGGSKTHMKHNKINIILAIIIVYIVYNHMLHSGFY